MNDLTIKQASPDALQAIETPMLRAELARALALSAEHLCYLAAIWAELERRGEDLNELRTGLAVYLPLIAAGQLDAEAVVRFAGQRQLLRHIATLPITEQRRLAQGGAVPVLTVDDRSAEYRVSEIPAHALTGSQVRLVFDDAGVRNIEAQRAIIESAKLQRSIKRKPTANRKIALDSDRNELRIGRVKAPLSDVLGAIAEAYGQVRNADADDDATEERATTLIIKLMPDEHKSLKIRAAEASTNIQTLVRGVLAAAGMLSR